jgi:hypothetical protein
MKFLSPERVRDDQNVFLRGWRVQRRVPGLSDVGISGSLSVGRPGLVQSFNLGVILIGRDREVLVKFERHPRCRGPFDAIVELLVRRYMVYNFTNE